MSNPKKGRGQNAAAAARKGAAGRERAAFFAAGGSPQSWNGGRMWTATDGRKQASKTACRGRIDATR